MNPKKTIAIGIAGGIAVYKIAELVSRLKKEDYEIIVVMTEAATKFVNPLTFQTLSNREVITDLWQDSHEWKVQHIGIAESIDLLVIAPATANIIAKIANGIGDDILSTLVLANTAPLMVFPAMNTNMYLNPAVQRNIAQVRSYGHQVFEPASGILACGASGPGRLPEIDDIFTLINRQLNYKKDFAGRRFLINAGNTSENIDPVRFISNRGTGKMGFAIAEEAIARGAEVTLISGNTHIDPPLGCELISVWSAEEMFKAMLDNYSFADVIIGSAAVCDFKPAAAKREKIKKSAENINGISLDLIANPDIIKEVGKLKSKEQILVGFAAETNNLIAYASNKLIEKNLDMVVANDITQQGAGFAVDTNIITLITKTETNPYPLMTKKEAAKIVLDKIFTMI